MRKCNVTGFHANLSFKPNAQQTLSSDHNYNYIIIILLYTSTTDKMRSLTLACQLL